MAATSNKTCPKPLRRGTARAACVRALCECGPEGADIGTIFQLMIKQGECQIQDTPASRKYVGTLLRSSEMFVKVRFTPLLPQ